MPYLEQLRSLGSIGDRPHTLGRNVSLRMNFVKTLVVCVNYGDDVRYPNFFGEYRRLSVVDVSSYMRLV